MGTGSGGTWWGWGAEDSRQLVQCEPVWRALRHKWCEAHSGLGFPGSSTWGRSLEHMLHRSTKPGKGKQTGGRDLKPSFITNCKQRETREQVRRAAP